MKLLTEAQHAELLANGRRQQPLRGTEREIDLRPVVKLFNPCGAATWPATFKTGRHRERRTKPVLKRISCMEYPAFTAQPA